MSRLLELFAEDAFPMKNKNWICIEISCDPSLADDLAAEIAGEFEEGVEITVSGIRFYVKGERLPESIQSRLHDLLQRFQDAWQLEELLSFQTAPLIGDDWANRWKEYFKPLRIGRRFVVCPTWEHVEPDPGDLVIRMDPGMAFGTGQHETTRLCLEWLEEWAESGGELSALNLLDVGTGSGILAIGAALLGFGACAGVDNDPEAIAVAAENVALNRLEHVLTLHIGTVADIEGAFDVVLANIQALPLIEMARMMYEHVRELGKLALSGILIEQRDSVQAAYEAVGFELIDVKVAGEWCLLAFEPACREGA